MLTISQPRRGKKNASKMINNAALKANINPQSLQKCISSGRFTARVNADEKEALSLKLRGTPANIIVHHQSGKIRIRQGAASLQTFRNDIAELTQSVTNN